MNKAPTIIQRATLSQAIAAARKQGYTQAPRKASKAVIYGRALWSLTFY